eukprot:TRINITY_DN15596_c0_g1_i1.p1 TRINITY_DN15596_c0_g1~~TRINITY_DN15596_c0_g1_i1.p1  ORF type:complete len:225 (+),score=51.59 TRINITY_DN15596_c0_g1_i1:137-811(+)
MPVYKYFGNPAKFHGKPLFHILSNLKNFGRGRIITRAGFKDEQPSFYRVLFAQPLMDTNSEEGRVIAEKVKNGVKYTEPVDLSKIAPLPDFILIPRDEEEQFCKWNEIREYSADKDYVVEPKYFTMPPLLRIYMEREMKNRGAETNQDSYLLPHYKTFQVKDTDELEEGKFEKYQETITRCEGTAPYRYDDLISKDTSTEWAVRRAQERWSTIFQRRCPSPRHL